MSSPTGTDDGAAVPDEGAVVYELAEQCTSEDIEQGERYRATVNGVELTAAEPYLGETALPMAAVADDDRLEFVVAVVFPELPLQPVRSSRTVDVA
jgi:hypothetical protein